MRHKKVLHNQTAWAVTTFNALKVRISYPAISSSFLLTSKDCLRKCLIIYSLERKTLIHSYWIQPLCSNYKFFRAIVASFNQRPAEVAVNHVRRCEGDLVHECFLCHWHETSLFHQQRTSVVKDYDIVFRLSRIQNSCFNIIHLE